MIVGGAVIAGIITVIGIMWFVKNAISNPLSDNSVVPTNTETTLREKPTSTSVIEIIPNGGLNLTEPFDFVEFRSAGIPVIIDFGADSCIPCKQMAPVLAALHDELKGKAIIRFVDVWKYRELAEGVPLRVIPTQVFFDSNGRPFIPSEEIQIPMTQYVTRDTNDHVFTAHEGGLTKDQLLAVLYEMGMNK